MQRTLRKQLFESLASKLSPEDAAKIDMVGGPAVTDDGLDSFGFSREYLKGVAPAGLFFYRKWFRTEVYGIENVPDHGPAIIVPNHSGQIPLDGMLIMLANIYERENPRLCRAMVEKWFATLPYAAVLFPRIGQLTGLTENAEKLMESGELMIIFPEGIKGSGKTWDKRYQLQRFTMGFMELSIKYKAPIIPCAVIGGEEQAPAFMDIKAISKPLGMPYFPITPTFPWLGLLGFVPLPSKYRIYFDKPLDFSDRQDDLNDPDRIREHVESVKAHVQGMIDEKLKERPFPGL